MGHLAGLAAECGTNFSLVISMARASATSLEELANATTHGVGLVASVAALPFLIAIAMRRGDALVVAAMAIFGLSLVSAYATSTIYHAVPPGRAKEIWRRLDHCAIYLLIAGTYTPFGLGTLRGPWGWSLIAVVWTCALIGIYAQLRLGARYPRLSMFAYLGLGWLVVIVIQPLLQGIGWAGFRWLLAGGMAYTVGVVFFACDRRLRFGHCAWHLFVIAGSVCHVIAAASYGIQLPH